MGFIENLERYTKYANGDIGCKCNLEVQDKTINDLDFSVYDLNNSYFGGVTFNNCDFSTVYLSGSNFGGSIFNKCVFKDNRLVKADWNDVSFDDTRFTGLIAFRTTFLYSNYVNTTFKSCDFKRVLFDCSQFENVIFDNCVFEESSFDECTYKNVRFIDCKISDITLANIEGVTVKNTNNSEI